ncbi:MAG: sigma-70 family RNA polymerase sigma factor [Planctomycetes bacterium]|nr:sigma-70 family RNA polymerase sigma factor [Planctomycetota bacterium]
MHFPSSSFEEGAEFEDFADIHSAPIDPAPSPIQYNEDKLKELFTELVAELRQRAVWSMQGANPGHTLQPTALIGEAYLRLSRSDELRWESKAHFLCTAAKVMRDVLVDHARKKRTLKRNGTRTDMDMDALTAEFEERGLDLEKLDLALKRLEREQPAMATAIQLRFFAGVEMSEIADILEVSKRTLERRMATIRSWLRTQIDA